LNSHIQEGHKTCWSKLSLCVLLNLKCVQQQSNCITSTAI